MAEATLAELRQITNAVLIPADLGNPDDCRRLVEEAAGALGGLDVLVSNAAIQTQHSLLESSREIFEGVINVNLRAAFLLMRCAHPHLKRSSAGRIILITSVHGKRPTDFDAAYAVSKGGLEMLCREAAIEFARDGITVNLIAPGGVIIEGKTGNPKPFSVVRVPRARMLTKYPLGRPGLPKDTAAVACFLAGEEAEHITGTTVRVDGGTVLL
jgi:glucose 1-dehydrogenase